MNWRTSTYTENGGESCVETASDGGLIHVRDTTDRDGGTLAFTGGAWKRFTASLR